MARKPKLPKNVSRFVDRHGKEHYRFRKVGCRSGYLPGYPGSTEFNEALAAFQSGAPQPISGRVAPRTIGDLLARFYRSASFLKAGDGHQRTVRGILEPFRAELANDLVANFRFQHIEAVLLARAEKRVVGKRTIGGPGAAENLHEQLKRLFAYAMRLGWISRNAAEEAELPVKPKRAGFYSWTEEDIAAFQRRHPLGTKARLALELMLWTGLRRSDAVRVGPQHIKAGRIRLKAGKTGKSVDVLAAPPLLAAIAATPAVGMTTLLVTEYGRPFTAAGFGGWFRDRCDEAGLPQCTAHGLRKALARRAADLGATQQQLKAVGQWSSDGIVATYVADAEQRALADSAVSKVIDWDAGLSNLRGES
jgi:integrase